MVRCAHCNKLIEMLLDAEVDDFVDLERCDQRDGYYVWSGTDPIPIPSPTGG
jgi:hypothetical protein